MIRLYLKQAWRLLQDTPVLSAISILGTALAVCLIMVMIMAHEVRTAPYPPEVNRDRMLFVSKMGAGPKGEQKSSSHGSMSYLYAQKAFKPLRSAQLVSAVGSTYPVAVSRPGSKENLSVDRKMADAEFWQMFAFDFVEGAPYDEADVASSRPKAVLVESVARKLYGTTAVVGEEILIDYISYRICGVVRDVSTLASSCYAQVWVTITSVEQDPGYGGIVGDLKAYILARSSEDFDAIRSEVEELRLKCNEENPEMDAYYLGQPDTQFTHINRIWSNVAPDMKGIVRQLLITILVILLVPAINLSGMTSSRMRKRLSELGVRRAFGAKRSQLLMQVLWENLVQTSVGSLLGLLLAVASTYLLKGLIYGYLAYSETGARLEIDLLSLLSPRIFAIAFGLCLVINLLSALLPAYRVSRRSIVSSLLSK